MTLGGEETGGKEGEEEGGERNGRRGEGEEKEVGKRVTNGEKRWPRVEKKGEEDRRKNGATMVFKNKTSHE